MGITPELVTQPMNILEAGATQRMHKARSKATLGGILGELVITLGVFILLFVVWELLWTNIDSGRTQDEAISIIAQDFALGSDENRQDFGMAPLSAASDGETFGLMYIPRFGKNAVHPVSQGVSEHILSNLGIGHYPDTQMPGEDGNFAVAAHRQTHGQVFWDIDKFIEGDKIYLQTKNGFYIYQWRETEIVSPTDREVLLPVPHESGRTPDSSLLTMTSCHPPFTTRMRIIAYADEIGWRPAEAGAPPEIQKMVTSVMGGE